MAVYQIVCVYRIDVPRPERHSHLVAIGTVDEGESREQPTATWVAADLRRAQKAGHHFRVGDRSAEVRALERPCPLCGVACLKPEPLNSLEGVEQCKFQ